MSNLQRRLSLFGLTMVAIGSSIGAGIFATPGEVALTLPHAGWIMVVWILGGLVALTGAITFAELGGMFQKAGGVYIYLRETYGELPAFLYGWVTLLVVNTGSLAALALIFAKYAGFIVPLSTGGQTLLALVVIVVLTAVNILGVQHSQRLISTLTLLKLGAILGIILTAALLRNQVQHATVWDLGSNTPPHLGSLLFTALIGVLWSFGGWHHASYLAGETRHPQRNVPLAMLMGAVVVTLTYLLVNVAYLWLLPLDKLGASQRVAGDALEAVLSNGGLVAAIIICTSVLGTLAIYTMSAPRIYFAMAQDGVFFQRLARLSPRLHTPVNAMLAQAGWAVALLLFWQHFSDLITYVTFIDIAFMALAGWGVVVLRRTRSQQPRPYRVWAYPLPPLVFVGISMVFLANTLWERPMQALAGLLVLGAGVVVYYGLFKNTKNSNR